MLGQFFYRHFDGVVLNGTRIHECIAVHKGGSGHPVGVSGGRVDHGNIVGDVIDVANIGDVIGVAGHIVFVGCQREPANRRPS